MRIGSLFTGIGGLDLGLERAGLGHVVWQVEVDPWRRSVLARHWPGADRSITDVRKVRLRAHLAPVHLICGGFPCKDVSKANADGRGVDGGEHSGLWADMARIVGLVRPALVVVENVSALNVRGLGTVLGDLARLRYDAEWSTLSACRVGAPHVRARVFVVAHARRARPPQLHIAPLANRSGNSAGRPVEGGSYWSRQPRPMAVVDGLSAHVARRRIAAFGDAVVPDVGLALGLEVRRIAIGLGAEVAQVTLNR